MAFDVHETLTHADEFMKELNLDSLIEKTLMFFSRNFEIDKAAFISIYDNEYHLNHYYENGTLKQCDLNTYTYYEIIPKMPVELSLRQKRSIYLNSIADIESNVEEVYLKKNKSKSIACLSLFFNEVNNGVLYIENTKKEKAFLPEKNEEMAIYQKCLSIALHNAIAMESKDKNLLEKTNLIRLGRDKQLDLEKDLEYTRTLLKHCK